MPFWTIANQPEPMRKHRWKIEFSNISEDGKLKAYYADKVKKPTITVSKVTHKYLGHPFNFPGNVEWGDVTIELVDVDQASFAILTRLREAGYSPPKNESSFSTISKDKAFLGDVNIVQLGAGDAFNGDAEELNTWTLKNGWIQSVDFDELDYSDDAIMKIKLTIVYDYATFSDKKAGSTIFKIA